MTSAVVGSIRDVEVIAAGPGIRILPYLHKAHGDGRWRKMKASATTRLQNGIERLVELPRYEAHGVGRKDLKIKRYLY